MFAPGEWAPLSDTHAERRSEDVAEEDGQNWSGDDRRHVPEVQLFPTVVDDQHAQQGDRRVDHTVGPDLQPTDPGLLRNGHGSTLRSSLVPRKPPAG